jgi:FkbM family methyltransferase
MLKTFNSEFAIIESKLNSASFVQKISNLEANIGNRPLALYGGGIMLGFVLAYCKKKNLEPICICDSYKTGTHEQTGLPIVLPEQLFRENPDTVILITSLQYEEQITEHLLSLGFLPENIFPFRFTRRITLNEFNEKHLHGYEWAYNFFNDEISKKLARDFACSHLTSTLIMSTSNPKERYFDREFIKLRDNEVFIDGGAHIGATTEEFIKRTNDSYNHVYAFEPESSAYKKALEILSPHPNIEIIPKGLWSMETELEFAKNIYNPEDSTFVLDLEEFDKAIAAVTSLDNYFDGKTEMPTFIKLNIEGAEKQALLGMVKILKNHKPKLAVSAYHKIEDIYELMQLISSVQGDYNFTLRQYGSGYFGAVLYAV